MKSQRHAAILRLVRDHPVPNQHRLRALLARAGFAVTQATLSRDVRELALVKLVDADGRSRYAAPADDVVPGPRLAAVAPALLLRVEGVGPLLVVTTPRGSANTLAEALDREEWPEILGTLAGDDTILVVARSRSAREALVRRLARLLLPRH